MRFAIAIRIRILKCERTCDLFDFSIFLLSINDPMWARVCLDYGWTCANEHTARQKGIDETGHNTLHAFAGHNSSRRERNPMKYNIISIFSLN